MQIRPGTGPPVLVGGCPRSGTTLLRTMLNNHPHLAMPLETQFVVPAWRRRELFGDLSRADNRRDVARWILSQPKNRYADRIGIPKEDLVEGFAAAPPTLGSLMATVFSLYAERDGKPRWGDKRPSYSQNLDAVFDLFPNARFVNVVRDPRACVASMSKAFSWGRPVSAVDIWERTDRTVQRALRRMPSDQITQVYYEDLVADPEATLKRLCDFFDLDPAHIDDMLDYHRTGEHLPTGQLHANAAKPVTTESLDRWSSELDEADIGFIEHVLADRLRHHGYELSGGGTRVAETDLAELKKVRARRNRDYRRRQLGELKRRFTYRQPLASAVPAE